MNPALGNQAAAKLPKKIADSSKRSVTFCKRKRGLLKKAIELSCYCD